MALQGCIPAALGSSGPGTSLRVAGRVGLLYCWKALHISRLIFAGETLHTRSPEARQSVWVCLAPFKIPTGRPCGIASTGESVTKLSGNMSQTEEAAGL